MLVCLVSLISIQNVNAKSKVRHEYCWFEYVSPKSGDGWNVKKIRLK